jgi:hypothetical protein
MQRSAVVRAIQVTCPHCGARLKVGDGDVVSCEYCGTASRVQRRTMFLERVKPPPPVTHHRPVQIAIQTKTRTPLVILLFSLALPAAISGFVIYQVQRATSQAMGTASSGGPRGYVRPEDRPPTWQGMKSELIADVNADGTPDIIGRGRQVHRGDVVHVMALDGKTGATRWLSDPIGTYSDTYQGPLALAGDMVVFGSKRGDVQAFSVATGARLWRTSLTERVKYFCAGDDATIVALTNDNLLRPLGRKDGGQGPATKATTPRRSAHDAPLCKQLPSDDDDTPFPRHRASIDSALQRRLGVYADKLAEGPGGRVLGAARSTGTRVTQLIALDDKNQERWRVLAANSELGAEGPPQHLVVGDHAVCAMYNEGKTQVACFAMADGSRLWDGEAPSFASGLTALGPSLLVRSHRGLEVRDMATGKVLWKLER